MRPVLLLSVLIVASPPGARCDDSAAALITKARKCLSRIEGEIALPGLKERVEVLRDIRGVPHLYARNQDDLFFAQGFVTAQDRLFQMDWWRRMALGETSEVIGKK